MPENKIQTVMESLNQALHAMMETDRRVVVIGEDILDPYGGAFKISRGLSARFPERVLSTPISEAAIVGLATGMAMRGFRPIVEIMFGDFLALAADQIINHATKFEWMYNHQVQVPLVVRTPMGGRRGYGPTHSQSLEKHFLGVPGLWVVAPSFLGSPGALLQKATLGLDAPVLFVENKSCYSQSLVDSAPGLVANVYDDDGVQFPTHYLHHENVTASDGLIFCHGGMVQFCLDSMIKLRECEGLFMDIIVFSQLSPVPVRTLRRILEEWQPKFCIYVEENNVLAGWSSEIMAQVDEIFSGLLLRSSVRHLRIGSEDVPIASSRYLETLTLPQVEDIADRITNAF
ncbi:MAG: alpha-ketoacid dehydrogenase subunit beta [Rhodospirillaceae bacterium]|nr:alpha-ketoacid dehydrogenase subunit beta [Rhodospirillaceae bacterium]